MTEVDDAESVAFGIRQHDEVRIVGIAVPVDTPSAQGHQSVGFRRLLGGVGDVQVQVEPRLILGAVSLRWSAIFSPDPDRGTSTVAQPPKPSVRGS